jgi:hypothetical protein
MALRQICLHDVKSLSLLLSSQFIIYDVRNRPDQRVLHVTFVLDIALDVKRESFVFSLTGEV